MPLKRIQNIAVGWGRSLGILSIPYTIETLSLKRLSICKECDKAKESKILKVLTSSIEMVDSLQCTECGCPCLEKSLVLGEKCPLNKW